MSVIAVINRKGGSGKSTLATHVAAWLSLRGDRVMLGDVDRQQSSRHWLRRRQDQGPAGQPLDTWAIDAQRILRPPLGVRHAVLDTPGGLHGLELSRVLGYADLVLVPVCDSAFDLESTAITLAELRAHPRVASGRARLALVGMRLDSRRRHDRRLRDWVTAQGLPYLGGLRLNQAYVHAADQGLTVFDLDPAWVQPDLALWRPITDWLAAAVLDAEGHLAACRPQRPAERGAVRGVGRPAAEPLGRSDLDRPAPSPVPAPVHLRSMASETALSSVCPAPLLPVRAAMGATPVASSPAGDRVATGLRGWLGWLLPLGPRARSRAELARLGPRT